MFFLNSHNIRLYAVSEQPHNSWYRQCSLTLSLIRLNPYYNPSEPAFLNTFSHLLIYNNLVMKTPDASVGVSNSFAIRTVIAYVVLDVETDLPRGAYLNNTLQAPPVFVPGWRPGFQLPYPTGSEYPSPGPSPPSRCHGLGGEGPGEGLVGVTIL